MAAGEAGGETEESAKGEHCAAAAAAAAAAALLCLRWETGRDKDYGIMFRWPRSKRQNERQEKSSKLAPRQLSIKWRRGNELAIKIKID